MIIDVPSPRGVAGDTSPAQANLPYPMRPQSHASPLTAEMHQVLRDMSSDVRNEYLRNRAIMEELYTRNRYK